MIGPRLAVAEKLSGYIGLPTSYIIAANLRIEPGRFRKELLRSERLTVGRYDSRFTGQDVDFVDNFFVPGIQRAGGLRAARRALRMP